MEVELRFGDRDEFNIQVELVEAEGGWLFGKFLFGAGDIIIGDPEDAADLRGCRRWLEDFLTRQPEVAEDTILGMTPDAVFQRVIDPLMAGANSPEPEFPDAFRRFNISHLGMSSFDRFDVVLLGMPDGRSRLCWRESGMAPRCVELAVGEFRAAVRSCVRWMDDEFPAT